MKYRGRWPDHLIEEHHVTYVRRVMDDLKFLVVLYLSLWLAIFALLSSDE